MDVHVTADAAEFTTAAAAFLTADPVENNLPLTILDALGAGAPFGTEPPWFATAIDGNRVVGTAMRTPPYLVALPRMSADTATALGAHLADRDLPGAVGPEPSVAAFAAGSGHRPNIRMRELQHVLRRPPVAATAAGAARSYADDDRDLVVAWLHAFNLEAGLFHAPDPATAIDQGQRSGAGLWLWEVDGEPVSMAGSRRAVHGVPRIGPVWTPLQRRGNGYAAALTAHVCRAALDAGAVACTLFADAANATSNGVYRRIGFTVVGEIVEATFEP